MKHTYEQLIHLLELAADTLEQSHASTSEVQHQVRDALSILNAAIRDDDYGGTDLNYYVPPEEL
jgi:hypothetical protein